MLADLEGLTITLDGLEPAQLFLGKGDAPVEVVVATARSKPPRTAVREAWSARHGGRPAPLVLVVEHDRRCTVCAAAAGEPEVHADLEMGHVERLCRAALAQPSRHAAIRLLAAALPQIGSDAPGLRNEGLFATHELIHGVPRRADWDGARAKANPLLRLRDRDLIRALGFEARALPGPASLLVTSGGAQVAVAVFLDESEAAEIGSERFGGLSPVLYALAKADEAQVGYVIVSGGAGLRLYTTSPGAGVGQRGRTETFAEVRLDLLRDDQAAYLWLLFSADALRHGGSVTEILDASRRYAVGLETRLRDRIYADVVPRLAEAIHQARGRKKPTPEEMGIIKRMALTVLFRLLFIAYAEDQDLLPFRSNEAYRRRALKTKAREIRARSVGEAGAAEALWPEVVLLFQAVDRGRAAWGVPAYDGGLFSEDPEVSPHGAALAGLALPESKFALAFEHLLLDDDPSTGERGPVDFRSLSVREFGTIYEGLLESDLTIAETDLAYGRDGRYRPVERGGIAMIRAGEAYLGTRSGERKASGTYFTKRFAVEHLLDHALEPALAQHLDRLDKLDERAAGEAFFDFRVADLAMGSGHFLVAAIDRIERGLSRSLVNRPLAPVRDELARLRQRAREALGPAAEGLDLEDAQLLRRQIARRCIYGVDLNPDSVELARLSIWVHTFVPGLPLSVLDHHLVVGDSLVGVGTLDEAARLIDEARAMPLFRRQVERVLEAAREAGERLARLAEADAAEVREARKALKKEREAVEPARALFDVLAATRLRPEMSTQLEDALDRWAKNRGDLAESKPHRAAREAFGPLEPFHFALVFPEVFLRDRPGFDVILGNPPWEEATIEEDDFWTRWDPGYQGLPQHERERRRREYRRKYPERVETFEHEQARAEALRHALVTGPYPGMGTGDPDTYKAFAWRFWQLVARPGGRIGVVLPRGAWTAKGSTEWRKAILGGGRVEDITFTRNTGGWVFDDAEPRDVHSLVSIAMGTPAMGTSTAQESSPALPIRGPYESEDRFCAGVAQQPFRIELAAILRGTDTASLPLLPTEKSIAIYARMREAPRLDANDGRSWRARPFAELHATNEKKVMCFADERPEGFWPVFKGASFDIWKHDRGADSYYAWVEPDRLRRYLQQKRLRPAHRDDSPFAEFDRKWLEDAETLPCLHPRIAFRDVARADDTRTARAALVPPNVVITNSAPYLLWPRGDERDQAFLLGALCSIPLDWYARLFVDKHLNYFVFNPLPVPRPARDDPRWQRVVALAGRLAAQDRRFRKWASKVGVECGPLDDGAKDEMIAELDAVVAHLYGLTDEHVRHIFETFHEGWDYAARLERVLGYYETWRNR